MNPYSNPNNGLNNQSVSRNQKEDENTPNYFQQFPQMNENQNNQLNPINLNNMLNQNNQTNQNNQLNQQKQKQNLSQIKQIQEKSEMMCQQRDQRQPKLSYTIDHNPSELKSHQTYLNETKREIETKPKHSTEVELLGQRLKELKLKERS